MAHIVPVSDSPRATQTSTEDGGGGGRGGDSDGDGDGDDDTEVLVTTYMQIPVDTEVFLIISSIFCSLPHAQYRRFLFWISRSVGPVSRRWPKRDELTAVK